MPQPGLHVGRRVAALALHLHARGPMPRWRQASSVPGPIPSQAASAFDRRHWNREASTQPTIFNKRMRRNQRKTVLPCALTLRHLTGRLFIHSSRFAYECQRATRAQDGSLSSSAVPPEPGRRKGAPPPVGLTSRYRLASVAARAAAASRRSRRAAKAASRSCCWATTACKRAFWAFSAASSCTCIASCASFC